MGLLFFFHFAPPPLNLAKFVKQNPKGDDVVKLFVILLFPAVKFF